MIMEAFIIMLPVLIKEEEGQLIYILIVIRIEVKRDLSCKEAGDKYKKLKSLRTEL